MLYLESVASSRRRELKQHDGFLHTHVHLSPPHGGVS